MSEFIISYEGIPSAADDDPATITEWPVDHPIASSEWRGYAIWVENAFSRARLANGVPLPPGRRREHTPDECVNFIAYRAWMIEHCPTATFVAENADAYDRIKVVFTDHREAMNHKIQWEGPGPAGD